MQIFQEKDLKIFELQKQIEDLKIKLEESETAIESQDKYLDEFEVKIENLEKDAKIKEDLM